MDNRFNSLFINFAVGLIFYAIAMKIFPGRQKLSIGLGFIGVLLSAICIGVIRDTYINQ